MPTDNKTGNYRFLGAEGQPFSGGAVADSGFDLVHATFERPLPLDEALEAATRHLRDASRPTQAIAGFELRIPAPLTANTWGDFNRGYIERLKSMGLEVDGLFPAARSNLAIDGVSEPSVYGFHYTVPGGRGRPAYVMSGAPEEKPADLESMLKSMMRTLSGRMGELGVSWEDATRIQLYGVDDVQALLVDNVLRQLGPAGVHGIHWFPSRPPIEGLILEIDVRAAGTELTLPA